MSYDEVPYTARAFAQTHPDRLAAIATLHGLAPPAPATARILELGCGEGTNALAIAAALPGATVVGLDNAVEPIRRARAAALPNATFLHTGLEDYAPDGTFDYVIAHGVFSWIPDAVRDALLRLTDRVLAPDGVAYVSYNALPGGRLRGMLREALAVHLAGVEGDTERIAAARGLLGLLIAAADSDAELAPTLARAARELVDRDDAFIFHDVIAAENEPFSIEGFVARARAHGLDYLSEAQFSETQTGALSPALQRVIASIGDPVRRELYLDMLKERRFRQTLLCRPGRRAEPDAERLAGLAVTADLQEIADGDEVTFAGPGTASVTTADALVIRILRAASAAPVRVADLGDPDDGPAIRAALMRCYAANLVRLHA